MPTAQNWMRGVTVYNEKLHHSVKGDKEPLGLGGYHGC